ncbi:hypothetical protein [Francisella philomiragia]|uniref:hypothetical protein n=1 Tax=Francisella philomiragia TaxID=28110 RepID=UPI001907374F|nr:hypothetical protein [Francisella philomiragia]MBK2270190.1 hypothetical protein [Francisella philomiragia]MBK2275854.1 hypothetical protein [Francisella philomiragia]MBK2305067.1 hypothetical protein [Francisella philomiragia]
MSLLIKEKLDLYRGKYSTSKLKTKSLEIILYIEEEEYPITLSKVFTDFIYEAVAIVKESNAFWCQKFLGALKKLKSDKNIEFHNFIKNKIDINSVIKTVEMNFSDIPKDKSPLDYIYKEIIVSKNNSQKINSFLDALYSLIKRNMELQNVEKSLLEEILCAFVLKIKPAAIDTLFIAHNGSYRTSLYIALCNLCDIYIKREHIRILIKIKLKYAPLKNQLSKTFYLLEEIHKKISEGMKNADIARLYNVSQTAIRNLSRDRVLRDERSNYRYERAIQNTIETQIRKHLKTNAYIENNHYRIELDESYELYKYASVYWVFKLLLGETSYVIPIYKAKYAVSSHFAEEINNIILAYNNNSDYMALIQASLKCAHKCYYINLFPDKLKNPINSFLKKNIKEIDGISSKLKKCLSKIYGIDDTTTVDEVLLWGQYQIIKYGKFNDEILKELECYLGSQGIFYKNEIIR